MRQSKFHRVIATVVALVVCLAFLAAAQAADVLEWHGGDGNWVHVYNGGAGPDPQGWDYANEPNPGLLAQVTSGATVTVDTAAVEGLDWYPVQPLAAPTGSDDFNWQWAQQPKRGPILSWICLTRAFFTTELTRRETYSPVSPACVNFTTAR